VYCRRHAGVVRALPEPGSSTPAPLPDLDNRAPSLVGWVARELDASVKSLMQPDVDAAAGDQIIADPVTLVFFGVDRSRAWEQAWKLATHEGTRFRLSVLVEEADDVHLVVKVGANVAERLVPPWIQHRIDGVTVSVEDDRAERAAFNQRLLDAMSHGLARERELQRAVALDTHAGDDHAAGAAGGAA
jgi:hypothetical protein